MTSRKRWRWGVGFTSENLSMEDLTHYARMAEEAGADSVWMAEVWRDAFVPLTALASVTQRVRVGTGIAQFARPPMHTELSAMSLAEYTGGRFVLGLGTGPPEWNEDWHGLKLPKPATRMREYIECIRTIWSAAPTRPVNYDGEFFNVKNYLRFMPATYDRVPIYLAGVNPRMVQLAGSHADGLISAPLNTHKYLTEVALPNLKKGMDAAGRTQNEVEVCLIKICAVNRDAKQARDLGRHAVAFFSTLPYYDIVLDPMGFAEEKLAIREAMNRGDIPGMLNAVTDEMIDELILAGTPDDVHRQLERLDGLFDTVQLVCPTFAVDPAETKANHEAMIEAFST